MLRKLLGDNHHDSRFIKTIPKRGYRFETDVHEVFEDEEELIIEKRSRYSRGHWCGGSERAWVSSVAFTEIRHCWSRNCWCR